jgi:peptidoglycan/xylan/chitin deacetylase (PgdA/CDA1 family)
MAAAGLKSLGIRYMRDRRGGSSGRSVVLLYHSVDDRAPYRSVSCGAFGAHLDWLMENTDVLTLESLLRSVPSDPGARPRVAITFDDGFADNHEGAMPLLAERGLQATFFITTGLIARLPEVVGRFARVHACGREEIDTMDWRQVEELYETGMEIGAHTVSHPNLAVVGDEALGRELGESKADLEDRLGVGVERFAYPFGKPKHNYDARVAEAVARVGFKEAFAVTYRPVPAIPQAYRIPRYSIVEDDLAALQSIVAGGFDPLGWWQLYAPAWLSARMSPDSVFDQEISMFEPPTHRTGSEGT